MEWWEYILGAFTLAAGLGIVAMGGAFVYIGGGVVIAAIKAFWG